MCLSASFNSFALEEYTARSLLFAFMHDNKLQNG